jgi:hypothetical protein
MESSGLKRSRKAWGTPYLSGLAGRGLILQDILAEPVSALDHCVGLHSATSSAHTRRITRQPASPDDFDLRTRRDGLGEYSGGSVASAFWNAASRFATTVPRMRRIIEASAAPKTLHWAQLYSPSR